MSSRNIADDLAEMARRRPHALAVVFPDGTDAAGRVRYTHYTYAQLDARADRLVRRLEHLGVTAGVRAVLMAPPSLDFFALVFALFRCRAVLVCIDPGLGLKHLGRCLAEAAPAAFIGVPKAHAARKLFGWARNSIRSNIVVGAKRGWGLGVPLDGVSAATETASCSDHGGSRGAAGTDDVAAILFTSGSTGPPKGVAYTHANFAAQLAALGETFEIKPGEIDLATFPLFALYAPALGMTAVVPEMDFTRPGSVDPRKIARAIEDFGVTNLFGSPALLDRVSRWGAECGAKFPSLRRVISAGAPVSARVIERMTAMLSQGVQVLTPYGATESLPVASIGSDEILGQTRHLTDEGRGVCVGRPVGEARVKIIRTTDEPIERYAADLELPQGQIGEIIVAGPAVTAAYHARAEATRLAKIVDDEAVPFGFWHRMGDLGYFDEQGRLWFCGRKSQRVRAAKGEMYTIPCEGVFNAHPAVRRTALVGIGPGGQARPVICVERAEGGAGDEATLRRELLERAARFEHTRAIRDVLFHPSFPVDIRHNAKIGREALARWAAKKLG